MRGPTHRLPGLLTTEHRFHVPLDHAAPGGERIELFARDGPVFFTGEMIFPWMFDEYGALRPLREAAHMLAEREDWPALYDAETLRRNSVPCAAVIYDDDMYVERRFSVETAETIAGLRPWITNRYDHNGLRADGETVLGRLLDTLAGD